MYHENANDRQRAFDEVRQLISAARAAEILRWKNWEHGGVLGGAPQPECPKISDEEQLAVKRLWLTLDDSSCWMSDLYLLCNDKRPTAK